MFAIRTTLAALIAAHALACEEAERPTIEGVPIDKTLAELDEAEADRLCEHLQARFETLVGSEACRVDAIFESADQAACEARVATCEEGPADDACAPLAGRAGCPVSAGALAACLEETWSRFATGVADLDCSAAGDLETLFDTLLAIGRPVACRDVPPTCLGADEEALEETSDVADSTDAP